jgi:eukaryotic-like serine/threonine-protein kinase
MTNLVAAYIATGQLDLAIPLCERTILAQRSRLGPDHPDTLTAMNNLAVAYEGTGQRDRAIPLQEQVLALRLTKLGENHPDTQLAMSNLTVDYWFAGRLEPLIPLTERLLEVRRVKLGADHPDTLMSMNNLAMAYMALDRFDRLIPFCEDAVRARQARRGADHPETLTWMSNLAKVYVTVGDSGRAVTLLERVVQVRQDQLGADHPDTMVARKDLSLSYMEAGRYRDAERLGRELVEAAGKTKPRNDAFYCDLLTTLGECLSRQQKHDEAVAVLRECVKIMEATGPDDWQVASLETVLGEALCCQKSYAEAERLLLSGQRELVQRSAKIPLHYRRETLRRACIRLIRLYEAWNKPAEAQKFRKQLPPAPSMPAGWRENEGRGARPPGAPSAKSSSIEPRGSSSSGLHVPATEP